jgi:hypothetical protein
MSAYHTDRPKQEVGPWLAAAIFLLPAVFAWATLQRGFSDRSRGVSFAWMFCVCGLIALAIYAIIWPSVGPAGNSGETALTPHLRIAAVGFPMRNGRFIVGGHPVIERTSGGTQFLDDKEHSPHRHDCPRDEGSLLDISLKSGPAPIDDTHLIWSDQPLDTAAEADQPQIIDARLIWRPLDNCIGDGGGSGHEAAGGFALGAFSNVSFSDWSGPSFIEGGSGGNPPGPGGNPPGGGGGPGGNPPGGGGGPGSGPGSPDGPSGPPGGPNGPVSGPGDGPGDPPGSGPGDGPGGPPGWGPGNGPGGPPDTWSPGGDGGDPSGPDNPPFNGVLPGGTDGPVAGAPEPAEWIVMILGTFILGLVLRRRRVSVASK